MGFVLLLKTAENGNRVLNGRLPDHHLLETAFQRRVLLDVLTVFVESRRADHMEFATRERGLQHVAGVHRAFGLAGSDHRMQLIDEENDAAVLRGHFLQKPLQAFLEFTAVLGAGNQPRHVERQNHFVLQRVRHFAVHDTLRETFNDSGLANARFTDQDRIILRTALQDLHRAADFIVAADHRIELPLAGLRGEVNRVLFKRAAGLFGVRVIGRLAAAHFRDRGIERAPGKTVLAGNTAGIALLVREGKKEHLGRDEFIAPLHRLFLGEVESVREIAAHLDIARGAGNLREVFDRLVGCPGKTGDVHARALEQAHRGAILIVKDCGEQMHGLEKLVVVRES